MDKQTETLMNSILKDIKEKPKNNDAPDFIITDKITYEYLMKELIKHGK